MLTLHPSARSRLCHELMWKLLVSAAREVRLRRPREMRWRCFNLADDVLFSSVVFKERSLSGTISTSHNGSSRTSFIAAVQNMYNAWGRPIIFHDAWRHCRSGSVRKLQHAFLIEKLKNKNSRAARAGDGFQIRTSDVHKAASIQSFSGCVYLFIFIISLMQGHDLFYFYVCFHGSKNHSIPPPLPPEHQEAFTDCIHSSKQNV